MTATRRPRASLTQAEGWGQTPAAPSPSSPAPAGQGPMPAVERGALIVLRQFDVANEIHLDKVQALLSSPRRPLRKPRATPLVLSNPPVEVPLGVRELVLGELRGEAELSAVLFDFGAVSVRVRMALPVGIEWATLSGLVYAAQSAEPLTQMCREAIAPLLRTVGPALDSPSDCDLFEDYVVVFVERFAASFEGPLPMDGVARMLLGESADVRLADAEVEETTRHRSSYYGDDLCVAGWSTALVVEPGGDTDPIDVLELANAQLLELRLFDELIEEELGGLYDELEVRRSGFPLLRGYGPLLRRAMAVLLDIAEFIERVENSLKITGDVYLARLYANAVESLRIPAWERSVTRKQALMQQVYDMLNSQVDASRGQLLELIIVLLIVGEIVMALYAYVPR